MAEKKKNDACVYPIPFWYCWYILFKIRKKYTLPKKLNIEEGFHITFFQFKTAILLARILLQKIPTDSRNIGRLNDTFHLTII